MNTASIRLFQQLAYGWLALYMLSILLLDGSAWVCAPVDLFTRHEGARGALQEFMNALSPFSCSTICVVIIGLSVLLIRTHRWWLAMLVWLLFRVITHRMWLASNGGIQLMENMLLWSAFMGASSYARISTGAFWIARLQLLLVYAVAAAHKFTGHAWLDGTAVLTVANDPDFHLGWLATSPVSCAFLTYGALTFMSLFPLAVWWSPSRKVFLVIGALFHLATAVFMDIPQMGLAFVVCYAIWLQEDEAAFLSRVFNRTKRVIAATT
ncbi:MAG: HTTM domain-containing protein [Flavobacteriales bacterium]|nr:HTTM domain-containing protein [Flavobacteriales bacterium]